MRLKVISFLFVIIFCLACSNVWAKNTIVVLETNMGNIEIELFEKEAPLGTANFLNYVDSNFYKDVIFHRVIKGFMVQGGGFDKNMNKKKTGNVKMHRDAPQESVIIIKAARK